MFKSVLNKIKSNMGMFICLVVGALIITGVIASIPIYSGGSLKQMLATELDAYEAEHGKPSGQMLYTAKLPVLTMGTVRADATEKYIDEALDGMYFAGPKVLNYYTQINADMLMPEKKGDFEFTTQYSLTVIEGVEEHITVTRGEMYGDTAEDGVIDVIISADELAVNPDVQLGKVYEFTSASTPQFAAIKIRPVGVFRINDPDSGYWYETEGFFEKKLIASEKAFKQVMFTEEHSSQLTDVAVYCNFDFRGMSIDTLPAFASYYKGLRAFISTLGVGRGSVKMNCVSLINEYIEKSASLQTSLWVLNIPIIAMLALYMVMVTKLIIDDDLNEIATFKSRGAKTGYIFARYAIECAVISVISLVLGPLLGLLAAKYIGSAGGFLEFDSENVIAVELGVSAYVYAVIACVLLSAMILIPALAATRKTIVNIKHTRARKSRFAFWEKACADVICLAVSVGLFFIYKRTDGFNADGTVDPIVYVISSLFILGCGLLFIRLYPFIITVIFSPFKRIMPTSLYSAYTQVSRGGGDYRFLMLFLIMTLAVGFYNSGSARIINNNVEDTVLYKYGADLVINPDFSDYKPYTTEKAEYEDEEGNVHEYTYYEYIPEFFRSFPIEDYKSADYINAVSRVFYAENVYVKAEDYDYYESGNYSLMAIDPYEFGKAADCSAELNDSTFNTYLNVLNQSPTTVLVSKALAEKCEMEIGDEIKLDINESNQYPDEYWKTVSCFVGGIVDYWPTAVTEPQKEGEESLSGVGCLKESFVIMNFEYLYSIRDTTDFKLFIDLDDDIQWDKEEVVEKLSTDGLIDKESQIEVYRPEEVIKATEDSTLKALNGSFSIGFISTLTVAFVGFVIYWIMNVRKRKLQFGILRAMGLTKSKLTLMLLWEHLLTTGVSVVMGTVIGALTVRIFTPLLKVAYSESILPLEVVFNRGDNAKIFTVVALMLAAGIAVLSIYIAKLKINEAVKIGEE